MIRYSRKLGGRRGHSGFDEFVLALVVCEFAIESTDSDLLGGTRDWGTTGSSITPRPEDLKVPMNYWESHSPWLFSNQKNETYKGYGFCLDFCKIALGLIR